MCLSCNTGWVMRMGEVMKIAKCHCFGKNSEYLHAHEARRWIVRLQ